MKMTPGWNLEFLLSYFKYRSYYFLGAAEISLTTFPL